MKTPYQKARADERKTFINCAACGARVLRSLAKTKKGKPYFCLKCRDGCRRFCLRPVGKLKWCCKEQRDLFREGSPPGV